MQVEVKKGIFNILLTFALCLHTVQAMGNSPYPQTITSDNSIITDIANLSNCFDGQGNALFDDLYIYGRIWQERQDTNYFALPNTNSLEAIKSHINDIDFNNIVQDKHNPQLFWYLEPTSYRNVLITKTTYLMHHEPQKDNFGNTTCIQTSIPLSQPDTQQIISLPYNDTLPDSTITILSQYDSCSCSWTTSQGYVVRNYYDYEFISTSYHWIDQPDTILDTIGCIVMRLNRQIFNPHIEGTERVAMGELKYIDGATEWISPYDTAFIPNAPGGGKEAVRMYWQTDTIQDTFYWPKGIDKDTVYTILHFNRLESPLQFNLSYVNQSIYRHNTQPKIQNTITHADVLHYTRHQNTYKLKERFDGKRQGPETITANNKKIYFTGRLVPATIYGLSATGTETKTFFSGAVCGNDDGPAVIHIRNGGVNNIYLENFQIGTKSLGVEGDEPTASFEKVPRKYLSAAIALEGDGQDTHIHFAGRNYLAGNTGKQTMSTLYSAAIYLNVSNTTYISLTLDDLWTDQKRTKGLLKLEGSSDEALGNTETTYHCLSAPIYSGNTRTSVTFDGGNYHLSPADNSTSTVNFMMVSRRAYKTPMVNYVCPDIGSDVGDGLVYIKGGNFRMTTPLLSNPTSRTMQLANGQTFDREYYIMYMPLRTYITGGNFENCIVRTTDGDETAPNCSGITSCPTNGQDTVFDYYLPCINGNNKVIPITSLEPDAVFDNYNFNYLTTQKNAQTGENYIMAYLPSKGNRQCDNNFNNHQNWDLFIPSGLSTDFPNENRPLMATIKKADGDTLEGTNYLALCDVNPYYPVVQQHIPSNITETEDYTINKRVYLVTWTMADKWRILTMPFDVSDITLLRTWATDENGKTTDPDLEFDYYKKIVQTIIIKGRLSELRHELGMDVPLWSLYQRAVSPYKPTTNQSESDILPQVARTQQTLYPIENKDSLDGDFHLYEASEQAFADGQFATAWTIARPDSNGIIMHKGRTYAIMFPNKADKGDDAYNYWNGKYIVLEGPGQTISAHNTDIEDLANNTLLISGNATFCNYYDAQVQRFDWDFEKQQFRRNFKSVVNWTDSYIASSKSTWNINDTFDADAILNPQTFLTHFSTINGLSIIAQKNMLILQSQENQDISIFNPLGEELGQWNIAAGSSVSIPLQQGVYLVYSKQTKTTIKTFVY